MSPSLIHVRAGKPACSPNMSNLEEIVRSFISTTSAAIKTLSEGQLQLVNRFEALEARFNDIEETQPYRTIDRISDSSQP